MRRLVEGTNTPLKWLVVDAGAITSIDYSVARVFRNLHQELIRRGVTLMLVHMEESLRYDLDRHGLRGVIGADNIFDTLHEALAAISTKRVDPFPGT